MSCHICQSSAKVSRDFPRGYEFECPRCGVFFVTTTAHDDLLPLSDQKLMALASHLIRRMQASRRPVTDEDFFRSLPQHRLPTPAEMSDTLLLLIDQRVDGRPGPPIY